MRLFAALVLLAMLGLQGPRSAPHHMFCVGALHAQALQGGGGFTPEPGNPGHHEPPPGWSCSPDGDAAHKCDCHRECKDDQNGGIYVAEDHERCKSNCFADHCRCEVHKCE